MQTESPLGAKRSRQIERPRVLIGPDADQADQRVIGTPNLPNNLVDPDADIGLVDGGETKLDVVAQDSPVGAVRGQPEEGRERVRWHRRAQPLDHVAVVVVVRRLDHREVEGLRHFWPTDNSKFF